MNIDVRICNIYKDLRGKSAGASGYYGWIDFIVVFENNIREMELYLQPTFDEEGFVIGFDDADAMDDYEFLPEEYEEVVITKMNELIKTIPEKDE